MAQDSGLVLRGLLLLGMILVLVTVVLFVVFRPAENPPLQETARPELISLGVPVVGTQAPANVNWGALAALGSALPDAPGWEVRYNATLALARKGTVEMPFDVLRDMLDEKLQMRNFQALTPQGLLVVDEQAARRTVLNALKALEEWHKHKVAVDKVGKSNQELQRVYAAVDTLTQSFNKVVKQEAELVNQKIASGKW
jgi:hypothetical protein